MKKTIFKHILFIILIAMIITSYVLMYLYYTGWSYDTVFFLGYLFLIFWLSNTFYIKKCSGIGFIIGIGFLSIVCFIPLFLMMPLFKTDALGKFYASIGMILFVLNIIYLLYLICSKETKISLIGYSIFIFFTLIMLSLGYLYMCQIMFSQGT